MSSEERVQLEELRHEVHELAERIAKANSSRTKISKHYPLLTTAACFLIGLVGVWNNFEVQINSLEKDIAHHLTLDFHPGMKNTPAALAEIRNEQRHLMEQMSLSRAEISHLRDEVSALKKGLGD